MTGESRFAYARFAADQIIGAILSIALGAWTAIGAWRAETARQRDLKLVHRPVTL